ncbi:Coenzyme F420 hydrogenase/dehydrogenase, beta subunit C-terminal domain [Bacteroides fragilis]|nr:Coenzyme F420 hydrogenase/dehydrogenase, beta subunit C-terminal domain [Bacteroides fragilis]MCE8655844.1 Coenzyme F420 hydrogenase/dehydrogenase, beta subunit C-terminal domain [Bacteroides fragilis]
MIFITDKYNCCGCTACAALCPKQCIAMHEDEKGFLYPHVDTSKCIDCKLCEMACPVINQAEPRKPLKVFAAKNTNEKVRLKSSSGGIFSMIAERIINNGGVVFGARFNEQWEVVHDFTDTIEGLETFRGSKYVQSRIGNNFKKTELFLKNGREVLFTGTPCQIAGLQRFLRKDYPNLLTIDVICHGVPSPLVWRDYLKHILCPRDRIRKNTVSLSLNEIPNLSGISFRDKMAGWKKYSFIIRTKSVFRSDRNSVLPSKDNILCHDVLQQNVFLRGFLQNLYLRSSCYKCPSRNFKSNSDFLLGDFWNIDSINREINDDKGVSLVFALSFKALSFIKEMEGFIPIAEHFFTPIYNSNKNIFVDEIESSNSKIFWKEYLEDKMELTKCIKKNTHYSKMQKLKDNIFLHLINFHLDYLIMLWRKRK